MGKRILTISREFGSGGRFIGEEIAKKLADSKKYDAVICVGAVIRGATSHYDYVCAEVSKGIRDCLQNLLQRNQNCHRKRDCSRIHLLEEICLENHWKI